MTTTTDTHRPSCSPQCGMRPRTGRQVGAARAEVLTGHPLHLLT